MIKVVKNVTPKEWTNKGGIPEFPACCFTVSAGSFNKGRTQVYNVQFFFLDKAGNDQTTFETDVISDQIGIAYDIVELMRIENNDYSIDDEVSFNTISDSQEDYLAGVEFTTNITTQSDFDGCDAPTTV